MTMQNLLQQCRKKSHSKVLRFWVVLAAVALLLVLACRGYDWDALGRYKGDNISSLHYVRGRVVEVLRDDTKPDQLDPARSLLLLNPPSPKTWAAMLSTLAGVALAGGMFYLFSTLLHLSGMNDTNGEGLVLVAGQTGLELHWLLLVAVLISSLGAVMDVALSLASSLHELREADGKMSGLQLFAAGMRIGRDMIGTMSNTLILAFAGEAATTLLLLMAYGWHSSQLFASDYAAIQVAQGVASTLGVVLGVPITSGICAALYRPLKR